MEKGQLLKRRVVDQRNFREIFKEISSKEKGNHFLLASIVRKPTILQTIVVVSQTLKDQEGKGRGIQCKACKHFSHIARNCKSKAESSQKANIAKNLEQQEERLFMATRLRIELYLKSRLKNGDLVEVKGKGVAVVRTLSGNQSFRRIAVDVCGPMEANSLNGSKYFLFFIDEYRRMRWIYFLKQKSNVFERFVEFKAMVENETGKTIKILRSYNGGEYTSTTFQFFFKQAGIPHQLTVPYTPQQNGVSERKNRSILNMAGCLLFEKGLPKSFWAKVVNTSVYLLNRVPTKAVKGKTPMRRNIAYEEPLNFNEATNSKDWSAAMEEELKMIELNDTWKLVDRHKNKSVIGVKLKQALRAWYGKIDDHLLKLGFEKSLSEATLYVKHKNEKLVIVSLYVDNILVTGSYEAALSQFKVEIISLFNMNELGKLSYFLGMEVTQSCNGIFICQKIYAIEILDKVAMTNCKAMNTPISGEKFAIDDGFPKIDVGIYQSMIDSLLYLSTTRPDIMQAISLISRFMQTPRENHLNGVKRVLRCVKGTVDFGIKYPRTSDVKLIGYSNGMISWGSQKQQDSVAQSTAEAEYISTAVTVNQAVWLRKLLADVKYPQTKPTEMLCDNQLAVAIAKNPVFHKRTKHIKIKYQTLRPATQDGEIQLLYSSSEEQLADIFTKGLQKASFEYLRGMLGMCNVAIKEEC
ncbi:hypothetical protein SLEP1_g33835 [Rubroshorea leprosula]|uniref:Integrase catalytic domain-containing protein n=1 Tax=Rubroshorea leprosula TaxID=152421 RepID=A0AAV5KI53_9ROSI|nr:hypothetical protein SLEP1_g33835 [Rubroshorea leprosula]